MWIRSSEKILERIEKLEKIEERDRLELVRYVHFMLGALQRSVIGWMQWVGNPDIMVKFTQEELKEISSNISKFVHSFIEYDIETTELGAKKGLKPRKEVGKKRGEQFLV